MERQCISSGKPTEAVIGYSRAGAGGPAYLDCGNNGPAATESSGRAGDAYAQAKHAMWDHREGRWARGGRDAG